MSREDVLADIPDLVQQLSDLRQFVGLRVQGAGYFNLVKQLVTTDALDHVIWSMDLPSSSVIRTFFIIVGIAASDACGAKVEYTAYRPGVGAAIQVGANVGDTQSASSAGSVITSVTGNGMQIVVNGGAGSPTMEWTMYGVYYQVKLSNTMGVP